MAKKCFYLKDKNSLDEINILIDAYNNKPANRTRKNVRLLSVTSFPSCRALPSDIADSNHSNCELYNGRCRVKIDKKRKQSRKKSSEKPMIHPQTLRPRVPRRKNPRLTRKKKSIPYLQSVTLSNTFPYQGLKWSNNSCYLASLVQLLTHISPVRDIIDNPPEGNPFVRLLHTLVKDYSDYRVVPVKYFSSIQKRDHDRSFRLKLAKMLPGFNIDQNIQTDSSEIFNLIFTFDLADSIYKLARVRTKNKWVCQVCKQSKKSDREWTIPINVPLKETQPDTLVNCLDRTFNHREEMDRDNLVECEYCLSEIEKDTPVQVKTPTENGWEWTDAIYQSRMGKKSSNRYVVQVQGNSESQIIFSPSQNPRVRILRKFDTYTLIDSLPQVLFLSLKRFYFKEGELVGRKIKHRVNFESTLTISEDYLTREARLLPIIHRQYRLIGVIHHRGDSSSSGHYYCYNLVEGSSGPEWIKFDDETVTRIRQPSDPLILPDEILMSRYSGTAYLLSYQRMDISLKKYIPKFTDDDNSNTDKSSDDGFVSASSGSEEDTDDGSDSQIECDEYNVSERAYQVVTTGIERGNIYLELPDPVKVATLKKYKRDPRYMEPDWIRETIQNKIDPLVDNMFD